MPCQRTTRDVWRVEVRLRIVPRGKRRWIHLVDADTKEEADEWAHSFRYRTRYRVMRRRVGGANHRSGRRKKKPCPTMAEVVPIDSGAF